MRSILMVAMHLAAAFFFIWRAEAYVDGQGHTLLLARLMCIVLALMIAAVGLLRALESFEPDASAD